MAKDLGKAYWEGKERQRAISLWSMGSCGGSGFASLFGGLMVGLAIISIVVTIPKSGGKRE